ncbi:NLI interacting factor-like phosphatase [Raphidocelis subcapitata]|uniref:NLI interacting factor-like phosphatase n=1 Tax=Raphidocelis subcapitata TaxID=307507 RepID=A0A2V0NMY1_9CHLO|nr:NLI interacting factor-like phosphatase [Raphidocelis subcapitata]|eukprot:GBF87802.1 NLI interacting factor-like phosphatase [Raphidocelis subcapitata]
MGLPAARRAPAAAANHAASRSAAPGALRPRIVVCAYGRHDAGRAAALPPLAEQHQQQHQQQQRTSVRARALRKPPPPRDGPRPLERAGALALGAERLSLLDAPAPAPAGGGRAPAAAAGAAAPRLRVAVDVDEVLGRFVHALNGYCSETYGMRYGVVDYWVYEYAKVWGVSPQASARIVHEFFSSPHFTRGIPPIPGAAPALRRLAARCDLAVVTSRQHVIQDATLEWLDAHFPGTFQEVYFGNHFALEGASRSKSEICASIGAQVLIDDNVGYALDCADSGVRVLLYDWEGGYPWAKLPEGSRHPNITVVRNWAEVEAALAVMAPAPARSSRL